MTEPIDQTPEQTDAQTPVPVPAPEGDAAGPEGTPEGDAPKGNREARYRTERNEARAALEAAQKHLETLQRLDCERIAGEHLSHPGDLFSLSGNSVADYVTDGLVDLGKITADVEAILAERPGLRKPHPAYDRTQGHGNGTGKPAASWGALLRP
jgi:hypothetical protein